jgi:hypothetical protein
MTVLVFSRVARMQQRAILISMQVVMTDPACSAVALNLLHVTITHPLVAMTVLVFSRVARMKQRAILISM